MSREIQNCHSGQLFSVAPESAVSLQVPEREGFVTQLALVQPILGSFGIHLSLKYAKEYLKYTEE